MTREKKFRVWDKVANKMYYAGDGEFSIDLSGSLYDDSQTPPLNIDYRCVPLDYTGLKDKNDKEIYEVDILKGKGAVYFGTENIPNCCCSSWDVTGWFTKGEYGANPIADGCGEIIGNIYENPDLTK